jgi:3-deoxy-D-manno-octulosonate 8-phosphate phosphatase (KDO 8-P phosphatase)
MREGADSAAQKIKWIIMDVDGVMTDGGIIFSSDKSESKRFHVRDGHGITLARKAGLKLGIITGRISDVVKRRAEELSMEAVYQGEYNKLISFEELKKEHSLSDEEIAYIGDDVQDAPVMKRVGFAAVVADGAAELDAVAHMRTKTKGGHGAVREFIEAILNAQGLYKNILKDFDL